MHLQEKHEELEVISSNIAQDIIIHFADTKAYKQADDFTQLFFDDMEIQNAISNPENSTDLLTDSDISEIQNSLSNFINTLFEEVKIMNYPKIYNFMLTLKKYNLNLSIKEPYYTFYTSDKTLFEESENFTESLHTFLEIKTLQEQYPEELYDAISLHDFLSSPQNKLFQSVFKTDKFNGSIFIKKENNAKDYNQKFDILNVSEDDLELLYKVYIKENQSLHDKIIYCNKHEEYNNLINQIDYPKPTLYEAAHLKHKSRRSSNNIHYGDRLLMFHQLTQRVIILDRTKQKFEAQKNRSKILKKIKKFKHSMEKTAKHIPYSFGFNKYINSLQNILSIQNTTEMETRFKDLRLEMNVQIKHHINIVKTEMQELERHYKTHYILNGEEQALVHRLNKKFILEKNTAIQKIREVIDKILKDSPDLIDAQTAIDLIDLESELAHQTEILVIHAINALGEKAKKASDYDDYTNQTDMILEDLGIGIDVTFKIPDHEEYITLLQKNPKRLLTKDNTKKTFITIRIILNQNKLNNYRSLVCHNIAQGNEAIPVKLFKNKKELYNIIRSELSIMRREIATNHYDNQKEFEILHQQIEAKMNANLQRKNS